MEGKRCASGKRVWIALVFGGTKGKNTNGGGEKGGGGGNVGSTPRVEKKTGPEQSEEKTKGERKKNRKKKNSPRGGCGRQKKGKVRLGQRKKQMSFVQGDVGLSYPGTRKRGPPRFCCVEE